MDLKAHQEKAKLSRRRQWKFLDKLKKRSPKNLDQTVIEIDEDVFNITDCLSCANCCKTISPTFNQQDISRISSHLGMKPGTFSVNYLYMDDDGDQVLQVAPCPFLDNDNCCRIYEVRPKACREYPHTGKRKFHNHIAITKQNILVCPAAYQIVELLERKYS